VNSFVWCVAGCKPQTTLFGFISPLFLLGQVGSSTFVSWPHIKSVIGPRDASFSPDAGAAAKRIHSGHVLKLLSGRKQRDAAASNWITSGCNYLPHIPFWTSQNKSSRFLRPRNAFLARIIFNLSDVESERSLKKKIQSRLGE
jgi:hypothetical protein